MPRRRIRLAQNFLVSRAVVASFVSRIRLRREDTVYELGPGRGIITRELSRRCRKVVAIEKDPDLYRRLRETFREHSNVEIVRGDFIRHRIRDRGYRVVANIPFNATAAVMRKILHGKNPPRDAHLVVQREPARKYAGIPRSTRCSVLAGPWFDLRIIRSFRRSDFHPVPGVDCVLLRMARRDPPLIHPDHRRLYERFVGDSFRRRVFTRTQWKRLAKDLGFDRKACPGDLALDHWVGLFRFFLEIGSR
jgi:23S rRNA (adenine-N6)-dimethyltransferase